MAVISQIKPLFPEVRALGSLPELAAELVTECRTLRAQAGHAMVVALGPMLRAMNAYYSGKIAGQHAQPAEIERALQQDFNADAALARAQRAAAAHMDGEEQLEHALATTAPGEIFSPLVVCRIHGSLYGSLPEGDLVTEEGERIVAGKYRTQDVSAGRHAARRWEDIDGLMQGWAEHYRRLAGAEALLIGAACAHHRLTWIHPFIDGNGRAARLHTHLLLHAMGLTQGLWSPVRGLALAQEQYCARLGNADLPRRNDLDGRGPLSQEALVAFAMYFLGVCLDQACFMRARLDPASLRDRLKSLLLHLQQQPWKIGSEKSVVKTDALEALHYVAIAGPLERSRFVAMTGLGERTGRRVMASLLDFGVLTGAAARSPVAFGVPLPALRFLLPDLWPEAEADLISRAR